MEPEAREGSNEDEQRETEISPELPEYKLAVSVILKCVQSTQLRINQRFFDAPCQLDYYKKYKYWKKKMENKETMVKNESK